MPAQHIVHEQSGAVFAVLASALGIAPEGYHVVIMEDDDWYGPEHVETLVEHLERTGEVLASSRDVRRVNVPASRWNVAQSLTPGPGMTAVHADYVSTYAAIVQANQEYGDREAWKKTGLLPSCPSTSVGIKGAGYGLPGQKGCTKKHHPESQIVRSWNPDPKHAKMREWLGGEAECYLRLMP